MRTSGATPGDRGRFPGFDVAAEAGHWDPVTRRVVLDRIDRPPSVSFFDAHEESTARALCDRLLAQDAEPRVPVVEMIDARLRSRDGDGYRYDDMPEDWDAWRRSLAALDEDARAHHHGRDFAGLTRAQQRTIVERVRLGSGEWHGMPAQRVFALWMRYATTAFYSHPWAWNEIGFPGPAYPRGYKALAIGRREPFETPEVHPRDPIPWVERAERARSAHAAGLSDGVEP